MLVVSKLNVHIIKIYTAAPMFSRFRGTWQAVMRDVNIIPVRCQILRLQKVLINFVISFYKFISKVKVSAFLNIFLRCLPKIPSFLRFS